MSEIAFRPENGPSGLERAESVAQQIRDEIDDLCQEWLEIYNQHHRDVIRRWLEGSHEDMANCGHDTEYDVVEMGFNVGRIMADLPQDRDLRELVCHEVAHIPTWPLWEVCEDMLDMLAEAGLSERELKDWAKRIKRAGENATTRVHRAVMRAYNAKREP